MKILTNIKYILISSALIVSSCDTQVGKHLSLSPELDLFNYFEGEVKAWGMVRDFKGHQINRFEVKMKGKIINKDTLELVEDFIYSDGKTEQRIWMIKRSSGNTYEGKSKDIVGSAYAIAQGNALHWQYTLRLSTQKGEFDLSVEDWMFLQDHQHLFSIATMKKFGIEVASVHLFFKK